MTSPEKYIYPPAWTQQLGIFSAIKTSEDLVLKFIKAIPRKFKKVTIQFNSENKFQHKSLTERVNYILDLNKPYEEIYKGFRKDRKKRLREGKIFNPKITEESNFKKLKESFKTNYKSKINIKETDFDKLRNLISEGVSREAVNYTSVLNKEGELISSLLLFKGTERIVVLFSSTNSQGFKENTFTCLIDEVINKHQNSSWLLDFEGSNIKSIASFNKSFGAKVEKYFLYEQNNFRF